MSQKIRASSSKLLLLTRVKQTTAKQQIRFKGAMVVRGNLIRCLECKGFPSLQFPKGFQPRAKRYDHMPECSQKGLF